MYVALLDNPWIIVLIPVAILLAVRIFHRLAIGIYITAFLIPFEDATSLLPNLSMIKLLVGYTFLVWATKKLILNRSLKVYQYRYIILFLLWGLFSIQWSHNVNAAFNSMLTLIQLILFGIMFIDILKKRSEIETAMLFFIAGSFLTTIVAVFLVSGGALSRMAYLEGQNPASFSRSLGIALIFSIYFLRLPVFRYKRVINFISGLLLITIVLAVSRTTYVALFIAFIPVIFYSKSAFQIKFLLNSFLIAIAVVIFFSDTVIEQVIPRTSRFITKGSLGGRERAWSAGIQMIQDYPLFGVGKANFSEYSGNYLPLIVKMTGAWKAHVGPHNVYLAIQTELGIIGTLLFFVFLRVIYRDIKKKKIFNIGMMIWLYSLFLYQIVGGIGNTTYREKYYWLVFTVIIAFLNQRKENLPKIQF